MSPTDSTYLLQEPAGGRGDMDVDSMSREELIRHIKEMNEYLDNVVVLWGDKRGLRETLRNVATNPDAEYTPEEARNAAIVLEAEGAFEQMLELVRDSFDRGGIGYMISEKISSILEEVGRRHGAH
jgi:hypothetical protein